MLIGRQKELQTLADCLDSPERNSWPYSADTVLEKRI